MRVKIYVEGGGDSNQLKRRCRRGFSKFFEQAGFKGKMPKIIACGSRNGTFGDFCTAIKNSANDEYPLLLVDSEAPVRTQHHEKPWAHLKERDDWSQPHDSTDQQAHLMVQCMESWFLADRNCLKEFFGQNFQETALPGNKETEAINKQQIFTTLKQATRHTNKGKYGKGAHSFGLLENLDPQKVQDASPWAKRFIDELCERLKNRALEW